MCIRDRTWDEADRTAAVQQTRMAVDWITAQAKSYGVMPDLICDRTEDGSNAALTRSYLVQSAMRGGEDSDESTAFIEEMDALCESCLLYTSPAKSWTYALPCSPGPGRTYRTVSSGHPPAGCA